MTEKAVTYDSHHFQTHQTIQCTLMSCGWGHPVSILNFQVIFHLSTCMINLHITMPVCDFICCQKTKAKTSQKYDILSHSVPFILLSLLIHPDVLSIRETCLFIYVGNLMICFSNPCTMPSFGVNPQYYTEDRDQETQGVPGGA